MAQEAKAIIDTLTAEGFNRDQIHSAMEDGEYLREAGISQETAEEIHELTSA